jgi:PAS domain S-box-containing protein
MDIDRDRLSHIRELLKNNPRGMNVTQIAHKIGMNRISTAKYLEMLIISGNIDVKTFGTSKVYFLSERLPISAMLSLSSDFIVIMDKDLNIINVNDKFLDFTDLPRGDVLNKKIDTLSFPVKFNPPITANAVDALHGKERSVEASYMRKEQELYFNIKFIPLVFDDGQKGVILLFEDITEHKKTEQAIRDSEEKFRNVIEQSLDGIMLIDKEGTIIEFSKGVEHITEMNAKNMIGKKLWETEFIVFISGEYNSNYRTEAGIDNLKKFILEYLKTGISPLGITSFELTFSRPNKEKRVVLLNYSPIRSEKGNMICMIARDITERKSKEDEFHKAEETYRSLIELINDGVWEVDRNLVVTYVNPQLYGMLELKQEDVVGKSLMDIFSPEAAELFSKSIMPMIAERKPFKNVILGFVCGHHSKIHAEVSGIPLFDENGLCRGYRGVASDVTHRGKHKTEGTIKARF